MPPVKKTPEQRAKEKADAQAKRLEILSKLAKGELTAEEADKQLNAKPDRQWEITRSPDGQKVMLKGIYQRFPLTIYPAHIKRMVEEGFWDQMVALADTILAEQEKAGQHPLENVEDPPADAEAA